MKTVKLSDQDVKLLEKGCDTEDFSVYATEVFIGHAFHTLVQHFDSGSMYAIPEHSGKLETVAFKVKEKVVTTYTWEED